MAFSASTLLICKSPLFAVTHQSVSLVQRTIHGGAGQDPCDFADVQTRDRDTAGQ